MIVRQSADTRFSVMNSNLGIIYEDVFSHIGCSFHCLFSFTLNKDISEDNVIYTARLFEAEQVEQTSDNNQTYRSHDGMAL
jgi:hypothetical protein